MKVEATGKKVRIELPLKMRGVDINYNHLPSKWLSFIIPTVRVTNHFGVEVMSRSFGCLATSLNDFIYSSDSVHCYTPVPGVTVTHNIHTVSDFRLSKTVTYSLNLKIGQAASGSPPLRRNTSFHKFLMHYRHDCDVWFFNSDFGVELSPVEILLHDI